MEKRSAGILLPISSLPSDYGIGCFSKSAYEFVDWLKEAGQTYWPNQLWRFSLSVIFHICGKSLFHRSGYTGGRGCSG